MNEEFKEWPIDPNILIGNYGTVKSFYKKRTHLKRKNGTVLLEKPRKLKKSCNNSGYLRVAINGHGWILIHHLVTDTWLPPTKTFFKNKMSVNHIDGNKKNNYYLNLEYITFKKNVQLAHNKAIIINNKLFDSVKAAAEYFGGHYVRKYIRANKPDCFKVDKLIQIKL